MSIVYRPPVTTWDARQRLADDILVAHLPRRSTLRIGRMWDRLRGWPCPEATWARQEKSGWYMSARVE